LAFVTFVARGDDVGRLRCPALVVEQKVTLRYLKGQPAFFKIGFSPLGLISKSFVGKKVVSLETSGVIRLSSTEPFERGSNDAFSI